MSKISPIVRAEIYKRDGNHCLQCLSTENLTIDHIVPTSIGGRNTKDNYQTLCQSCNLKKGSRIRDLRGLHIVGKIELPKQKIRIPAKIKHASISKKKWREKYRTVYFHDDGCLRILIMWRIMKRLKKKDYPTNFFNYRLEFLKEMTLQR